MFPGRLDLRAVYPNHPGRLLPVNVQWPHVEGYRTLYRIAFQSMEVEGLPEQLQLGRVMLLQTTGPVMTRHTDIVQRPQARLVWDKTIYEVVFMGTGLPVTVCHLPVVLPTAGQSGAQFAAWRDEIYSAAGVLVALLDDRVAQRELFEDFVVIEETGWRLADRQGNIRNFLPFPLTESDKTTLDNLGSTDVPDSALAAARWYLRGAQTGPAADGIPLFWTALEAIVGAQGKQVVRRVNDALRALGEDPTEIEPSLGRLFGLRADIVHRGEYKIEPVVEGWYVLERVCRRLLRDRLGMDVSWPDYPGDSSGLADEVRQQLELEPQTIWHEADARA
jgi:hypothetical protein